MTVRIANHEIITVRSQCGLTPRTTSAKKGLVISRITMPIVPDFIVVKLRAK
jgi:hypothetical protein